MSEPVPPPREYKFVGAYSRKRRRRTGPGSFPSNTLPGNSVPSAAETAKVTTAAASNNNHSNNNNKARSATPKPASPLPSPAADVLPSSHSAPLEHTADHELHSSLLEATVVDTTGMLSPQVDWSYGSLMNPFVDFDAALDDLGGSDPMPFRLGPLAPLEQLGESPSTDDSGVPADDCHGHDDPPADLDEIPLPALDLHPSPCNLSTTITQLLTRYDQEFCVMPLTHDFDANPFRFDPKTGRGSQLLLHCILALSYKHINRETGACVSEAKSHKRQALQMLKGLDSASQDSPVHASFLDAILILMTLDCATSACGPWTWYLKRAHKMIQATEALHMQKTPRMQARIEMLVWWDVTLALTTRKGCVLSESTVISLLTPAGGNGPTFYSVSGCPEDLFRYMIRLGVYAREFELAATMTCVRFDLEPVLSLERSIRDWVGPPLDDLYHVASSETINYKEDLHHCAQAWRYGLLIYIERVFKWDRGEAPPPILGLLARRTLNHVAACRRNSMVQKQLLLPVFLAGCETDDESLRQEARLYCHWWGEKTRYDMFLTAVTLLDEVWATDDSQAWWGSITDQKSRDNTNYLFG